jgi:hypothetical protein
MQGISPWVCRPSGKPQPNAMPTPHWQPPHYHSLRGVPDGVGAAPSTDAGMSTGEKVGLFLGGLAIVGGVIYAVTK